VTDFYSYQPADQVDAVKTALGGEAVEMCIMLHLDFADAPLRLCNRSLPFSDLKWGQEWKAGGGLLVGLPEIGGGDGDLAPLREYRLGIPDQWMTSENWAADAVQMIADRANYRQRDVVLYGQLFTAGAPLGHPFTLDTAIMDRMSVSFSPGMAVITLGVESFLSRKGVPVYGMQTYFDQKRRFPDDEGLQFVTEAGRLITWTNW